MKSKAVLVVLVLGSVAVAQDKSLKLIGMDRADAITGTINVGGQNHNVYIGALKFSDADISFTSFCADPNAPLDFNFHNYTPSTLTGTEPGKVSLASRIIAANFNSAMTAEEQAGMQLAVWSAVTDGGSNFNANGNQFKVSNVNANVLNLASNYYSVGFGASNLGPVNYYASNQVGAQSQLQAVPEPATLAALGIGAAALLRRRKRQATKD